MVRQSTEGVDPAMKLPVCDLQFLMSVRKKRSHVRSDR